MTSIRSTGSIYSQGTLDREERQEDRFSRKLRELSTAEHEISKCKDALKQWQAQKNTLEDWVKKKMEAKGGCYCGELRYSVSGAVEVSLQCRCHECQDIIGGNPNMAAIFALKDFK